MKLKKVVDICKRSGQLYITQTEDAQWWGDGQAMYPVYDLPELTAEDICIMYEITEEQRDKMIMNEKTVSELGDIDLSPVKEKDESAEVVRMGLTFGGHALVLLKTSSGISFIKRKYLAPFREEVQFWKRKCVWGEYFVLMTGMFVCGVIIPETLSRADIVAELKEIIDEL